MRVLKTIVICVLLLAVTTGGIYLLDYFKVEAKHVTPEIQPRLVRSMVAERKSRRIDVIANGTVQPSTEIDLIAQVSGTAAEVSTALQNGGFFAKDTVLVQLDDRDYKLAVTRAKAQVAQAQVRVSQEAAAAAIAKREWEQVGKGKPTALALREPQVLEAKANLAAAAASLAKAELDLERTTVRAPFPGRVRAKHVGRGQFVAPGTPLARIYSVEFAEVRLPLHDRDLRYVDLPLAFRTKDTEGSQPIVELEARFAQKLQTWRGRIVRTEGELDGKSRMVRAIARITDPYGQKQPSSQPPLSVGMFVTGKIHGRTFENVVTLPISALRGIDEVLVIDAEKRMHRRTVVVLQRDATTVAIEKGLAAGERVCLSPIAVFAQGMRVALEEDADR